MPVECEGPSCVKTTELDLSRPADAEWFEVTIAHPYDPQVRRLFCSPECIIEAVGTQYGVVPGRVDPEVQDDAADGG